MKKLCRLNPEDPRKIKLPARGGIFRHVEMNDAPATMDENDQDNKDAEGGAGHTEKIYGGQGLKVIVQDPTNYRYAGRGICLPGDAVVVIFVPING